MFSLCLRRPSHYEDKIKLFFKNYYRSKKNTYEQNFYNLVITDSIITSLLPFTTQQKYPKYYRSYGKNYKCFIAYVYYANSNTSKKNQLLSSSLSPFSTVT